MSRTQSAPLQERERARDVCQEVSDIRYCSSNDARGETGMMSPGSQQDRAGGQSGAA